MAHILQTENDGVELATIDCDLVVRDNVSHLSLENDMRQLKSMSSRPKA